MADGGGVSHREHIESLLQRTNLKPERRAELEAELQGESPPPASAYLWVVFVRLHGRRASGMGPSPISWADIAAFSQLTGCHLVPWEIEIIESLDRVYLTEYGKSQEAKTKKQKTK